MNEARASFGICTLANGNVVVCGGYGNNKYLSSVEMYLWRKNKWKPLPSMPMARSHCEVFTLKWENTEVLIVCGGTNGGTAALNSCVLYNFKKKRWIYLDDMIQGPRKEMGFGKLNDHEALLVGGTNDARPCTSFTEAVVFDLSAPDGQKWQRVPSFDLGQKDLQCVGSFVM
jgi:hypothetical protein